MSMPLTRHYSPDDVRALPDDGNRYETVHGELLVTPAPGGPHQPVLMRLIAALSPYLKRNGRFAELLPSPGDISLGIDTLVQPDLFVADTSTFLHSGKWLDIRALYLVIEIVSPSSAIADPTTGSSTSTSTRSKCGHPRHTSQSSNGIGWCGGIRHWRRVVPWMSGSC